MNFNCIVTKANDVFGFLPGYAIFVSVCAYLCPMCDHVAGLSGVNENLLKKYSVRLVSYDRPGIGQSDPHLKRTLNSSAEDMADLADALNMGNKFWILAHSSGAAYAWAALYYIPNRLAGNFLFIFSENFEHW